MSLGVDVFYVLSGFLMTRSLLIQSEKASFRMAKFLGARVLRICPALLTTVLVTMALSLHVFPFADSLSVTDSGAAASMFRSNMHFLSQSGYHDTSSQSKPLLHTWSLSVEGQFYFLWSVVALFSSVDLIAAAMAVLCAGSVMFQFAIASDPSTLFFTLPGRLYQFGAGALALLLYDRAGLGMSNICHIVSVPLFGMSFALVKTHHHPIALISLPIVVGSMLLICTPRGPLATLLSSRIPKYIGQLSYSIYLVHWPCIVLATHKPFPVPMLTAAILTTCLSPVLYRCVEEAFRFNKLKEPRFRVSKCGYAFCFVLFIGIVAWSKLLHKEADRIMRRAEVAANASAVQLPSNIKSTESRFLLEFTITTAQTLSLNDSSDGIESRALARIVGGGMLEHKRVKEIETDLRSRKTMPTGLNIPGRAPPYTLIIGDSYATSLIIPMQRAIQANSERKIVQCVVHVCMPALDGHGMSAPRIHKAPNYHNRCMKSYPRYRQWIESNPPERVLLVARWQDYLEDPKGRERLVASIRGFAKHTARLTVLGVVPVPPLVSFPPKNILSCLEGSLDSDMQGLRPGTAEKCPKEFRDAKSRKLEQVLARMVEKVGKVGEFVSVLDGPLCRKGSEDSSGVPLCSTWTAEDGALYGDNVGHLTLAGAEKAWGMLNI